MPFVTFLIEHRAETAQLLFEHLLLVVVATAAAAIVAVPIGVALAHRAVLRRPILAVANVVQTIPSLALFGFLIPLLGSYGIGRLPAIIALFLYGLLPIIRNTYTGITGIDPAIREAARGMGMTPRQILAGIELPLALPVILTGIRIVLVQNIGLVTIAALIGAGGLGAFVFQGIGQTAIDLVLLGAIPTVALAFSAAVLLDAVIESIDKVPA